MSRSMIILYVLTVLIWGTTWLPIKWSLGTVAPEISVIYRLVLASAILFSWCFYRKLSLKFSLRTHALLILFGVSLYAIDLTLLYKGSEYLTSGLVAIIFSTIVLFNLINKRIVFKEPIAISALLGVCVGIAGLCIAFWPDLAQLSSGSLFSGGPLQGLLFVLGAAFAGSVGNITSAVTQKDGVGVTEANALGMLYGAFALILYSLYTGSVFNFDSSTVYITALLYLSVFGSVIAFGAYLTLIGKIGAEKAAYANLLFPVVAVLISAYAENFDINLRVAVAFLVILAGNYLMHIKPAWLSFGSKDV